MKNLEAPISQFPLLLPHFFYVTSTFSSKTGLEDRLLLDASYGYLIYKCLHLRLKPEKQSSFSDCLHFWAALVVIYSVPVHCTIGFSPFYTHIGHMHT